MFSDKYFKPMRNDFDEPFVRSDTIDSMDNIKVYFANVAENAIGVGLNLHIKVLDRDVLDVVEVVNQAKKTKEPFPVNILQPCWY